MISFPSCAGPQRPCTLSPWRPSTAGRRRRRPSPPGRGPVLGSPGCTRSRSPDEAALSCRLQLLTERLGVRLGPEAGHRGPVEGGAVLVDLGDALALAGREARRGG